MPIQVLQNLNDSDTGVNAIEALVLEDRQTIQISRRTLRDSGEMIAPVTIARAGIQLYKAKELGDLFKDRDPESVVRVNTPAEVLFDAATIELCRSAPVTINHPASDVNLKNNKELQKGYLEGAPWADGSHLAGNIVLNDEAAIRLVDNGVDQTSWGHTAVLERVEGKEWDCEKTKINSVNHVAIVRRGRAQTTRIGDSGELVDIVDRSELIRIEAERDAANDKVAALTAKLADAESVRLSDADIQALVDGRVKDRLELLSQVMTLGDSVSGLDFTGKSESEIKREVVSKLLDKDMSDRDDAYINVRFEIALEDGVEVNLSDALSESLRNHVNDTGAKEKKPSVRDEALARRNERFK